MTKKTLHFRTRGGPVHGWGNVIRLGSFAEFCRKHGHKDILFFVEGPNEVIKYLKHCGFQVIELSEDIALEDESDIFSKYSKPDSLIVEMEDCDYNRQQMLKEHAKKLVIFDDLLDHRYCADMVVCGQALPYYGNKEISSPDTQFLLGFKYFLCRPEFMTYTKKNRNFSSTINNVLISLGGGRYDVGYLKAAYALAKFKETITSTFILGYAVQERLTKEIAKILPNAKIYGGVDDIEKMFWQTDLAIVSGGYNKLEAAITATPAIMISVKWHQIPLAEEFSKITGMPYVGYMSFATPEMIQNQIENLRSLGKRKDLSQRARTVIDGKGFDRVYSLVVS